MALTHTREMLKEAQRGGYAVAAFNIENMEMAQAVIEAAAEMRSPVIAQTTPGTLKYAGVDVMFGLVSAVARGSAAQVALHLDHGDSFELAVRAIQAGYTSIMIDGSKLPFEENVELTARVVAVAKDSGIPVEGELGSVGGKEDGMSANGEVHADPVEAREFVKRTGVSSLAIGIGTAHGIYKAAPKLDFDCLKAVRGLVDVPLVLHGASGLSDDDVRTCIREGMCKVNFATELRIAYSDGVKEYISEHGDAFDPKKYGAVGRERVKQLVMEKMRLCGCAGRL